MPPACAESRRCDRAANEQDRRCEKKRRAHPPVVRRQVRDKAEQRRADHRRKHGREAAERSDRAHRLALRPFVGSGRHHALNRRNDGVAQKVGGDQCVHHPALRRERPAEVTNRRGDQPGDDEPLRAEPPDHAFQQESLHQKTTRPDEEQRPAVLLRGPVETERRIQHPYRLQDELREISQRNHDDQASYTFQVAQV
jgi:hypothetical protein